GFELFGSGRGQAIAAFVFGGVKGQVGSTNEGFNFARVVRDNSETHADRQGDLLLRGDLKGGIVDRAQEPCANVFRFLFANMWEDDRKLIASVAGHSVDFADRVLEQFGQ